MGIKESIQKIFKPNETKQSGVVVYSNVGVSSYRRDKYENYAEEGYRQNAIVYRCINEVSQGGASVKFKVFDGDMELDEHPLINILNRPNPTQARVEYFQSLFSYLLLAGNSYALKVGATNQPPTELYLLRPDRIRITGKMKSVPDGYEYILNGIVQQKYPVDTETGRSDIKQFKMFNPLDDYYGLSPLYSASLDIDQHNLSAKHNVNLLQNGARPSGAVVFKPKDESGMSVQLSESQRQQVLSDLDMRFSGSQNAGRSMLLEGDFDWKEMGLSPKDMDFLQLKNMATRDIALCFGVPSQLVGIPDANTYSNMAEARLALYEETIIPLLKRTESDLNEWLSPMFGDTLKIQYDIDGIPAMAERRKRIYENVVSAVNAGIISRNEARERLDLEPITGGDDVYIPANLFPLGSPETSPLEDDSKSFLDGIDAYEGKEEIREDVYTTEKEAQSRAEEIGCYGTHSHDTENGTVFMPCASHADYLRMVGKPLKRELEDLDNIEDKDISDVDLKPTVAMSEEAQQGLEWRKEFGRGGTEVGVARARQLVNRQNLSADTVVRMRSFFARHEVDKEAEGFFSGEEGYPSAGRIAWALWGGDAGFAWAKRKLKQIEESKDRYPEEFKAPDIGQAVRNGLKKKVEEHNEKHGDKKGKRVTLRMLIAVFKRGVGAYNTNPESVRPNVTGQDQWAYARVNAFLGAVRTGRFKSGQFDRDLLPKDHPLYRKKGKDD